MKQFILSVLACFAISLSFGQQAYIRNDTPDYYSVDLVVGDPLPSNNMTSYLYSIPPGGTIVVPVQQMNEMYVKCYITHTPISSSPTGIGALYSDEYMIQTSQPLFNQLSIPNPITGNNCTWSENWNPSSGHFVIIEIH